MHNFGKLGIMTKLQVTGIIPSLFDQNDSFRIKTLSTIIGTKPILDIYETTISFTYITALRITQMKDTIHKRLNILAMGDDNILCTTSQGIINSTQVSIILLSLAWTKRDSLNILAIDATSKDGKADNLFFTEI